MRKSIILLMFFLPVMVMAQGNIEYRMEIGAGAGLVAYEGDYNGSVLKGQQPMASVILRRLINPYHGFKLGLGVGKTKRDIGRCGNLLSGNRRDSL